MLSAYLKEKLFYEVIFGEQAPCACSLYFSHPANNGNVYFSIQI
jgi:hypothetical protein